MHVVGGSRIVRYRSAYHLQVPADAARRPSCGFSHRKIDPD